MISGPRILVATLALLVLGACTGDGEEQESTDDPAASAPDYVAVADLPARAQVRRDLREAVRDPDSQSQPGLPDAPVVGGSFALAAWEERCLVGYGWDSAEEDCVFGDPEGDREIVLWGDEQAGQWLPALSDVAAQTGRRLRVLAKYECPPLLGLTPWLATENRVHVECRTFNDRALAAMEEDPPEAVVVSGAIRGSAFVVDAQVVESGTPLPGNRWRPTPGAREIWQDGLERTLAALAEADVPAVVVGEVPARTVDPGLCLARNSERVERCRARRDDVVLEDHLRAVEQLTEAQGATHVDPTPWLCTRRACPAVAGGIITYRDSVLLTRPYVRHLARVLGEEAGLLPQE